MRRENKVRQLFKNNLGFLVFFLTLAFFRTAVADWNHVPSASMEPTLYDGDWLIVNKTAYGPTLPFVNIRLYESGHPKRGDIVTFVPPHTDDLYVKRVVGVPGDEIGFSGRDISVNGKKLEFTPVLFEPSNEIGIEQLDGSSHLIQYGQGGQLPSINGTFTVPESKYFVLGDHRNNSADSRYWGFVEGNNIMGKVTHVAFSISSKRSSERFAISVE
ncbi:signal peptidase I [Vibrio kasasachensis]|uniref:signal peptidase I n=1 Tax=Vibrio kasasachensis TaxID=2910248 RepID=UPI003D0F617E